METLINKRILQKNSIVKLNKKNVLMYITIMDTTSRLQFTMRLTLCT